MVFFFIKFWVWNSHCMSFWNQKLIIYWVLCKCTKVNCFALDLVIESCHGVDSLMLIFLLICLFYHFLKELNPNWGYISIRERFEKAKNLKIDVTYYWCNYGLKLIKSVHPMAIGEHEVSKRGATTTYK